MRILVINAGLIRLNSLGACEQDRLRNIVNLRRLGHDVHLVTGFMSYQKRDEVDAFYAGREMTVSLIPIQLRRDPRRWLDVAQWDGMAWEYGTSEFLQLLDRTILSYQPEGVWCHGSYLWSPARFAYKQGLPTVIRSVNYEPTQLLHENGRRPSNLIRYLGKTAGERRATHVTTLAAITPDEEQIYRQIAPNADVGLLPLQTLPDLLRPPRPQTDRRPLHVFFMGASYNIAHNRSALRFILESIIPMSRSRAPGEFIFHILGSKVPANLATHAAPDVIFDGFVADLNAHLENMDIALIPSLFGVGMQQKVFESICRAFPTITHARALAGYALESGTHVLTADTADRFVAHLLALRDPAMRTRLSENASRQTHHLFDQSQMDQRLCDFVGKMVGNSAGSGA